MLNKIVLNFSARVAPDSRQGPSAPSEVKIQFRPVAVLLLFAFPLMLLIMRMIQFSFSLAVRERREKREMGGGREQSRPAIDIFFSTPVTYYVDIQSLQI